MDAHQALLTRRTVHDYRSEPVDPAAVERALEAAVAAPNHRMTEPWRFVRVGPLARAQLAEVAVQLKQSKSPMSAEASQRARDKLLNPAELIVALQVLDDDPDIEREDYAAVACAIENFCLSLWADGIGSKWSTGGVTRDPRSYAVLQVDPARERINGFVWVGLAAAELPKARRRKTLQDVVRHVP